MLLVLFIWIIYSMIEGKREANYWHHKVNSSQYPIFQSVNEHGLFMLQRGLVLILISIVVHLITGNLLWVLYFITMNSLIFSFFHNGSMYNERYLMSKKVNPDKPSLWVYNKRWWAQSTTSTAVLTKFMAPISRTIQASIGIIGYIIYPFIT